MSPQMPRFRQGQGLPEDPRAPRDQEPAPASEGAHATPRPGWDPSTPDRPLEGVGTVPEHRAVVTEQRPAPAPVATAPRASKLPLLIGALAVLLALALVALFFSGILGPRKAAPTGSGSPSPVASSPSETGATPSAGATADGRTPRASLPAGTDKHVADIALPGAIQDLTKGQEERPGGVVVVRATYGDATSGVSAVTQRDHRVAIDGAGMREVKDAATYRCGRITRTAVCMSDAADGTVELVALDPSMSVERLSELMQELLRQV